jgi:hypothetical protein
MQVAVVPASLDLAFFRMRGSCQRRVEGGLAIIQSPSATVLISRGCDGVCSRGENEGEERPNVSDLRPFPYATNCGEVQLFGDDNSFSHPVVYAESESLVRVNPNRCHGLQSRSWDAGDVVAGRRDRLRELVLCPLRSWHHSMSKITNTKHHAPRHILFSSGKIAQLTCTAGHLAQWYQLQQQHHH